MAFHFAHAFDQLVEMLLIHPEIIDYPERHA